MSEVASTILPDGTEVNAQDQKDVEQCSREIMQTLQKWNCELAVGILITVEGNRPDVQIVKRKSV